MIRILGITMVCAWSHAALAGPNECTAGGETAKLTCPYSHSDPDLFGGSVALQSGTVVVGAWEENRAFVFDRAGKGDWPLVAELGPPNSGDEWYDFAYSVAYANNTVAANVWRNPGSLEAIVCVFERSPDGTWDNPILLQAPGGELAFGVSLAMYEDRLLVGAPDELVGAAYLFERQFDGVWLETHAFSQTDGAATSEFGSSVGLFGDTVLIGAPDDGLGGSAYVFERQLDGSWSEERLMDPGPKSAFGSAVAIDDGVLVVTAPNQLIDGMIGAVHTFGREEGSWIHHDELVPFDGGASGFGNCSVSVSVSWSPDPTGSIVVGRSPDAFVFEWGLPDDFDPNDPDTWPPGVDTFEELLEYLIDMPHWHATEMLQPSAQVMLFANSVSVDGDTLVAGSMLDDFSAGKGAAYVFEKQPTGSWNRIDLADDCNANGICDIDEIADSPWKDANENGVLDECEVGACCIATTVVCELAEEYDCLRFGGQWQGLETTCEDVDCPTSCLGDVTGDGEVSIYDLLIVLESWGPCP